MTDHAVQHKHGLFAHENAKHRVRFGVSIVLRGKTLRFRCFGAEKPGKHTFFAQGQCLGFVWAIDFALM